LTAPWSTPSRASRLASDEANTTKAAIAPTVVAIRRTRGLRSGIPQE
jgi:hypothetical protein